MIRQVLILFAVAAYCSATGDGRGYYSKKNTFQQSSQLSDTKPPPFGFSYNAQLDDGSSSMQQSKMNAASGIKSAFQAPVMSYQGQQSSQLSDTKPPPFGFSYDAQLDDGSSSMQQSKMNAASGIKSAFQAPVMSYQGQQSSQLSDTKPPPFGFSYNAQLDDGSSSMQQSKMNAASGIKSAFQAPVMSYQGQQSSQLSDTKPPPFGFSYDAQSDDGSSSMQQSKMNAASGIKSAFQAPVMSYQGQQSSQLSDTKPPPFGFSYNAQLDDGSSSMQQSKMNAASGIKSAFQAPVMSYQGQQSSQLSDTKPPPFGFSYDAQLDDGSSSMQQSKMNAASGIKSAFQAPVMSYQGQQSSQLSDTKPPPFGFSYNAQLDDGSSSTQQSKMNAASGIKSAFQAPVMSYQGQVEPIQSFQPSPYSFNYVAEASGGSSSRNESSDASGTVTGSYEVRNEDGSVRVVVYIADKDGFRANVKTNEMGTKSDNPADVTFKSDAPVAPIQQRPVHQSSAQNLQSFKPPACYPACRQSFSSADVTFKSDAPVAPIQQRPVHQSSAQNLQSFKPPACYPACRQSFNPADVTFKSDAPVAPIQQRSVHQSSAQNLQSFKPPACFPACR